LHRPVSGCSGPGVSIRPLPWLAALTGWRAGLAAAILGALSALALPPLHLLPVLLVAVPGLLALIDGAASPREASLRGFWFGFAHHLIGLYWVTEAVLIEAARYWWLVPLAVPALALVLAPFIAVACGLARLAPQGWRRALVLAGAWVLADLLRQFVATGFPWNPWGADWAVPGSLGDVFLQPAAWIGVPGLTLLTLLVAATPALGWRAMLAGAAFLIAWAGAGIWRLSAAPPPAPGIAVVIAQGDIPEAHKQDMRRAVAIFDRYLALTREGIARARATLPDARPVVVWPESASPFALPNDVGARAALSEAAGGVPVLAGTVRFDALERPANSLAAILGTAPPEQIYDKWHLVPFGEFSPSWVPVAVQFVRGGFVPGPGPQTLHVPGLPPVGPLICYEAIFPAQVVNAADRPDWLVNVTNDAWFGNSSGPRQHFAAARLRAVEEGLPLVRAANTGISAVFDAFGRERARLGLDRTGELVVPLPGALPTTLFARFGLVLPGVLALVCVLGGLVPAAAVVRNKRLPKILG
jgi:apolipoprotein N-acyltransferase